MTDHPTTLAAALARVQAELPKVERDRTVEVQQKNGQVYSYSYVTLANLSDAVLPLLARHGLSFVAMPGAGSDGKMCVRYRLLHESGESLDGEFPISGEGGIQMIGGRITYVRRYCLAAIVGVAADEDDESRLSEDGAPRTAQRGPTGPREPRPKPAAEDGAATAQRAAQRPRATPPPLPDDGITTAQMSKLHAALKDAGLADREAGLAYLSKVLGRAVTTTKDLTKREAMKVINALEPDPEGRQG